MRHRVLFGLDVFTRKPIRGPPEGGIIYLTKVISSSIESSRQGGATNEMVLVPLIPTKEMIKAAWADALAEDAAGVWKSMIEVYLASQQRESSEG